jgi:hypothetical protein
MATFFNKPLPKSNVTNFTPTLRPHTENETTPKTKPRGIIDGLLGSGRKDQHRTKPIDGGVIAQSREARTADRPARSTRRSQPKYFEDDDMTLKDPERYSEVHGLGTPWEQ